MNILANPMLPWWLSGLSKYNLQNFPPPKPQCTPIPILTALPKSISLPRMHSLSFIALLKLILNLLYAGQEAAVRTGHGTDWLQTGKGVWQGCILSPCLFNLYAEYIMRNTGLEEAQAGIKIARRNINNFRYADDTTLWQKVKKN